MCVGGLVVKLVPCTCCAVLQAVIFSAARLDPGHKAEGRRVRVGLRRAYGTAPASLISPAAAGLANLMKHAPAGLLQPGASGEVAEPSGSPGQHLDVAAVLQLLCSALCQMPSGPREPAELEELTKLAIGRPKPLTLTPRP